MGEWFDLLADRFQLPRAPRLPREEVRRSVPAMQWSFMSESRRLDNARMKRELRLRLRYPTVVTGIAAARESHALGKSLSHPVRRQLVRRPVLPAAHLREPRHGARRQRAERERLLLMAGKLFRFMTPLGVLAVALGLWLWFGYGFTGGWLHAKTALVIGLVAYHAWCGMLLAEFREGSSIKSHVWFRFFNEVPVLALLVICILAW
jgi:uncharacterized membrane protein